MGAPDRIPDVSFPSAEALLELELRIRDLEHAQTADRARMATLELALSSVLAAAKLREEKPEKTTTVFGIPVVLAPGVDDAQVRAAVGDLPPGMGGTAVVDELERSGLVARKAGR